MSEYVPGNYVKDGRIRVANSAREAVALAFEGYVPQVADESSPTAPVVEQPKDVEPTPVVESPAAPVVDEPQDAEPTPVAPRPTPPKPKKD